MKLLLLFLTYPKLAKALSSGIENGAATSILLDSGSFFPLVLKNVLADYPL